MPLRSQRLRYVAARWRAAARLVRQAAHSLGAKVKEFSEKYEDGELTMDVQYLASGFKCTCCGLTLKGVEEVAHAGLDTHFIETTSTSLHDLYEPEHYVEYDNM